MKPIVWIVDCEQWPRANLRALLIDRGFDAIGFMELDQALERLIHPHYPKPHVIVIELHALTPTDKELNVLTHLHIPMVALAGAMETSQEWVGKVKWAVLIRRPITIGQVADAIETLMRIP
jgi:hypothetical protein